jgi:aminopeptidase N
MYGYDDAQRYVNAYKTKVQNKVPIIAGRGIHREPPQDMYFKGALFLNTLRNVVNDDKKWFKLIHDTYQHFKYRNIMTEDMVEFFNRETGMNLTPIFDQYLRHTAIPVLELKFDDTAGTFSYRWNTDEKAFAMPVRVGKKGNWQIIQPKAEWQTMPTSIKSSEFEVATDLYYVNVVKM